MSNSFKRENRILEGKVNNLNKQISKYESDLSENKSKIFELENIIDSKNEMIDDLFKELDNEKFLRNELKLKIKELQKPTKIKEQENGKQEKQTEFEDFNKFF